MLRGNFAERFPDASAGEIIDVLARFPGRRVAVERIVSGGHPSPEGDWYDQDGDEWVMLLRGSARIAFENHAETGLSDIALAEQDWLLIPAHCRHRVASVSPDAVWIAVHGDAPEESRG